MSTGEELHEQAEHASHGEPFNKRVAATMAMIAAALALVSVLGHMTTTEELLLQQKSSDQWAYYQAKSIRRYESEVARDILQSLQKTDVAANYTKKAAQYRDEQTGIQKEAEKLQTESEFAGRKARRFHFGELLLEIAIVLSSLAILTHREAMFWFAVACGLGGVAVAASVFVAA